MSAFAGRRWRVPPPRFLSASTQVRVRFQEVDGLQVVWHGHYVTYLEEGRQAFGRQFGLRYEDIRAEGFVVPLVHVSLDYFAPATYDQLLTVTARLHPESAARLTFTYQIADPDGRRLATGRTVQAFTDLDGALVLTRPDFYQAFLDRWAHAMEEEERP